MPARDLTHINVYGKFNSWSYCYVYMYMHIYKYDILGFWDRRIERKIKETQFTIFKAYILSHNLAIFLNNTFACYNANISEPSEHVQCNMW